MTVQQIYELGLLDDSTEIFVRGEALNVLANGNWFHDYILDYATHEVESFVWQNDNKFYIDVISPV